MMMYDKFWVNYSSHCLYRDSVLKLRALMSPHPLCDCSLFFFFFFFFCRKDEFKVEGKDVGFVNAVEVKRDDSGFGDDWHLDYVRTLEI